MIDKAVFYQLTHKFVRQEPPEGPDPTLAEAARQVVYYSLAIGHHVGVMDCFHRLLEIPLVEYQAWLEILPPGPAREKLAGLVKWGEIEINSSHAPMLLAALGQILPGLEPGPQKWTVALIQALQHMQIEPAMYLMGRKRLE